MDAIQARVSSTLNQLAHIKTAMTSELNNLQAQLQPPTVDMIAETQRNVMETRINELKQYLATDLPAAQGIVSGDGINAENVAGIPGLPPYHWRDLGSAVVTYWTKTMGLPEADLGAVPANAAGPTPEVLAYFAGRRAQARLSISDPVLLASTLNSIEQDAQAAGIVNAVSVPMAPPNSPFGVI